MSKRDPSLPPEDFDARLKRARKRSSRAVDRGQRTVGLGFALRIGLELVTALVVGVGIGWLLDWWLGTTPWLMILFFVVGAAAGMMNVYRTVTGIGHGVGYKPRDGQDNERG